MRNSTNCNSTNNSNSNGSNSNNNKQHVTTTTVTDHNKVPRVEKVVFDNRIKRKNVLALNEKVAAIREYEKRPVYKRIGRMFQCSPDQIKRIVQQKESILTAWEQRTRKSRDAKTLEMKVVKVSMLGKAVYEWIRRMLYYKDILITDGLIQKMALQFKSAMGLQTFFPHQEWCDKFRSTYKIFTFESKCLNIAYTQGHSVQIKDVMKDVLSECCPNEGNEKDKDMDSYDISDDDDDDDDDGDVDDGDDYGAEDDDCESMGSDEAGLRKKSTGNTVARDKQKTKFLNQNNALGGNILQTSAAATMPAAAMQSLRQFMALPMQANGLPGMGQKVLVATPIVGPGQKQGNGPMTMTIIPLATLGQPQSNINIPQIVAPPLNVNCFNTNQTPGVASSNVANKRTDDVMVPPPLIEIKQEIKEEPKDDEDNNMTSTIEQQEQERVKIKKEYLTEDEEEEDKEKSTTAKATTKTPAPMSAAAAKMPSLLPAHVVSIPLHNKDMLEDSSKDSLDDLTLSSLKKRMKIEDLSSTDEDQNERKKSKKSEELNVVSQLNDTMPERNALNMLPMPPLTKAPTLNATLSIVSQKPTTSWSSNSSKCHKRNKSIEKNNNIQDLPAIRTCGEARKYLKLLEDFALERENFRLIGLITRADEVLRELDRKESNDSNEHEDVEID